MIRRAQRDRVPPTKPIRCLVISGSMARYQGFAKINGAGGCGFILTAIGGQVTGGGGVDKLRMRTWIRSTGAIVSGNQMRGPDNADRVTPVGSGSSIAIQKQIGPVHGIVAFSRVGPRHRPG